MVLLHSDFQMPNALSNQVFHITKEKVMNSGFVLTPVS